MRRLVVILLALVALFATSGVAVAEDGTFGSDDGYWQNGREWRFQDTNVGKKCASNKRPYVKIKVARIGSTWFFTDLDYTLLQVQFKKANGTDGAFKEKEVGWYPSQVGEYEFFTSFTVDEYVSFKPRDRYTKETPYSQMKVNGPYGGEVGGVWAALSFNALSGSYHHLQLGVEVNWYCGS